MPASQSLPGQRNRILSRAAKQPLSALDQLGPKTPKLVVCYRSRLLQLIQLGDFVRHAEAYRTAQFVARLLSLLRIPLRHSPSLRDQIGEDTQIRKNHQTDHPQRLAPTGDVVASNQIAEDDNEQPEPNDKGKYGDHIHQKVGIGVTSVEEHHGLPVR